MARLKDRFRSFLGQQPANGTSPLDVLHDFLDESWRSESAVLANAFRPYDKSTIERSRAVLDHIAEMRRAVEPHITALVPKNAFRYVLDAQLLRESFAYTTKTRNEQLHFATGPRFDDVAVIDRIVKVPTTGTPASATAEAADLFEPLSKLDEQGYQFLFHFHSHPGSGPNANHPSSVDTALQTKLERAYECIGGIWSRTGHIRFFSIDRPFEIEIYGKGVEHHGQNLYKLEGL